MSMKTLLGLALLLVCAATARAERVPVVVLPAGGCPDQAAVDAELERLLPLPPPSAHATALVVADLGDRFAVAAFGAQRIFVDPGRDCGERARTAAVAIAVTLAPPTVAFGEPAAVDEALPAPLPVAAPAQGITRAAPHRSSFRHGLVVAVGASCLDVTVSNGCFGVARLGYELKLAELHVGFIGSPDGDETYPPAPNGGYYVIPGDPRLGVQLGADIGTPYVRLLQWGNGRALRAAGRASIDFDLWIAGQTHSADFSNTYGPSLAIDLSPHVSLSARVGIGWSTIVREAAPLTKLDVDASAGLLAQF